MNNNNKFRLMLLTVVTPLGITLSSQIYSKSLLEVYQIAAKNDPQLHQAFANFKAVEQNIPISVANLLPEVTLNAGISYDKVLDFGNNPSVHSKYFSLDFTQPLFYWDRISRYLQSELEVEKAIHDLEVAKEDLLMRVSEAYFNILEAEDYLDFVKTEKDAIKRLYDESVERFKVGLIPTADVDEAKAKLDLITSDEIASNNAVSDRYEELREIIGEDIQNINVLTPKYIPSNPKPNDIEQWVKLALDRNHTLKSEKLAEQIMQKNEDIAFAGHLPSLDFTAGYRGIDSSRSLILDEISNAKGYLNSYGAALEGRVEIFGGGGTQAAVNKAEFNTLASQFNTERARREAVSLTRQSYRNVLTNVHQIAALEQAVTSGLSALDATEASYEVGTRASIDVLDRLTDLYDQKQKLSASRYSYIKNVLALKRNSGVLTDKDIKTIDGWLINKDSKELKNDKSDVKKSILQKIKEFDNIEFKKTATDKTTTDSLTTPKTPDQKTNTLPSKQLDKTEQTEQIDQDLEITPNDTNLKTDQPAPPKLVPIIDNDAVPSETKKDMPVEKKSNTETSDTEIPSEKTPGAETPSTAEKLNKLLKEPQTSSDPASDPIKQLEEQLRQLETDPQLSTPKDTKSKKSNPVQNKENIPQAPKDPKDPKDPKVPEELPSPKTLEKDNTLDKLEQELNRLIEKGSS